MLTRTTRTSNWQNYGGISINHSGVGLGVNNTFMSIISGGSTLLNGSEGLASVLPGRGGHVRALCINIVTGFAAATTNTLTTRTNIATPSDAVVLTMPPAATGVITATGAMRFEASEFLSCLFNSDDATNPAHLFVQGAAGTVD